MDAQATRQGRFEHFSFGVPWEALANYSQAGRVGNLIFVSGQLSHELDGTFVGEGDTEVQCRKTFENLDRVLERFRVERIDIAQVDVFLVNLPANFAAVGSACRTYLGDHRPANERTAWPPSRSRSSSSRWRPPRCFRPEPRPH